MFGNITPPLASPRALNIWPKSTGAPSCLTPCLQPEGKFGAKTQPAEGTGREVRNRTGGRMDGCGCRQRAPTPKVLAKSRRENPKPVGKLLPPWFFLPAAGRRPKRLLRQEAPALPG